MAYTTPRTWVTGETVTATLLNTHVRDNLNAGFPVDPDATESWTPTLEGTTSNDTGGTVVGRKWRVGPMQHLWFRFVYGGDGTGPAGVFLVTLPVAAVGITANTSTGQVIGPLRGVDASASANTFSGIAFLATTTTARFAGSSSSASAITNIAPFTWSTNDVLTFEACYPVA